MRLYAIECTIERGAFSNERTFRIPLSDEVTTFDGRREGQLVGTAHRDHLLDEKKKRLGEDRPQYGSPIRGYVLCRKIRCLPDSRVVAEVPSADVIHVSEDSLDLVEQGY